MGLVVASLATGAVVCLGGCSGGESTDYEPPTWITPQGGYGGQGATPWTTSTGTGATGLGGQGGLGGGGGAGGTCEQADAYEGNDTESTAYPLTTLPIDDCDGSGSDLSAAITRPDDIDWFRYRGDDTALCSAGPFVVVVGGEGLRVCQYPDCLSTETTLADCPSGTTESRSEDGRAGCCGTSAFVIDYNCEGSLDEDAHIFLSVDVPNAEPNVCNAYVLGYHF